MPSSSCNPQENSISTRLTISVVIPTYKRPASLRLCLEGLRKQARTADEVLVIAQESDYETFDLLNEWRDWPELRVVVHSEGGAVGQYNRGLDASRGDITAITDDDAVPRPEWLMRIEQHFLADPGLGGVGGRDVVVENGVLLSGDAHSVGVVQWFGRVVGNHHLCTRLHPRVDALKGVNMAFRATAIKQVRFDTDLRGKGAQTCLDMAFSFKVQKDGWRLMFDPDVTVDHYPAPRFDPNQRAAPSSLAIEDNAFNFYITLRRHLRRTWRRRMALCWARLIGTKRAPGLIRGIVSRVRIDKAGIDMRQAAKRAWKVAAKLDGGRSKS